MSSRTKLLLSAVILLGILAACWTASYPAASWTAFAVLMIGVLASSGFKVVLPQGEGTMSLNFPFILLALVQLGPQQAIMISAVSVLVQCRFRATMFTTVQIAFNVANVISATSFAFYTYTWFSHHGLSVAPALGTAATAYFLFSTAFVAIVIAWSTNQPAWQTWKTQFPWYLPFYLIGAALAAATDIIGRRYGWGTSLLMVPVAYTLYRSYNAQIIRIREREQHHEETEALHLRTIEGLAMAIEAKDRNTHDHLFRVRNYVTEIGRAFQLDKLEMQALQTAAFLHDIGKLAVPEHIINKPGKLTPEEFEKMKIHPVVGADILERVRFPYPVVPIVRSHHEWWDGTGYPDGLKGEEIPIGARILSAVDCFDALASDRPYRRRLPASEAISIVKRMAGIQFDPKVVDTLEQHFLKVEHNRNGGDHLAFQPLDTEIDVTRGEAPAAGFAQAATSTNVLAGLAPSTANSGAPDPLNLIAAASQEAQSLYELTQALGNSITLDESISIMISRLRRLIPFQTSALYFKEGDTLRAHSIDGDHARCFAGSEIAVGEGISGWVALSGKCMLNGNAEVEPNYRRTGEGTSGLRSALSVPFLDLRQGVLAVLTLYSPQENAFSNDHLRLLQVMETKLSLYLQNAVGLHRAANDVEVDFLTSLPTARRLFLQLESEISRCQQKNGTLAVIVCDLKSFKEVNDLHGHLAGNMLLSMIAAQFRQSCRPHETIARMGGDEFVFLIPNPTAEEIESRRLRITEDVRQAIGNSGLGTRITANLGVASYPEDAKTAEELLALADRRMHLDKAAFTAATPWVNQMVSG